MKEHIKDNIKVKYGKESGTSFFDVATSNLPFLGH